MDIQISDVVSQIFQDNASDDDVIEVVRDEAPIEILSDSEELAMEKNKQAKALSPVENFHFTSLPSFAESHIDDKHLEDYLNDPLTMIFQSDVNNENSKEPVAVLANFETDGVEKGSLLNDIKPTEVVAKEKVDIDTQNIKEHADTQLTENSEEKTNDDDKIDVVNNKDELQCNDESKNIT